jgi:hypothetical protein
MLLQTKTNKTAFRKISGFFVTKNSTISSKHTLI